LNRNFYLTFLKIFCRLKSDGAAFFNLRIETNPVMSLSSNDLSVERNNNKPSVKERKAAARAPIHFFLRRQERVYAIDFTALLSQMSNAAPLSTHPSIHTEEKRAALFVRYNNFYNWQSERARGRNN
jgi:hypothetical protein